MNPKVKDLIGLVSVVGIVVLAMVAWMFVDAYSKSIEPSSFRSFAVQAEGKEVAVPDIAQFTFSIITEGGTNLEALQTENVNQANEAIDYLKAQGVEDKDITTQDYNVQPRYQTFNCVPRPLPAEQGVSSGSSGAEPDAIAQSVEACPPSEIVGYTIRQTVQVKVRDLGKAGSLLSGVVDNGANNVSQLFFTFDDRTQVESRARAKAIEKAKEKAEAVAEAGEFRMGRLLSIQESGIPYYPAYDRAFAQESGVGTTPSAAPAPSVEPGSQDITVNVTLVYEIQ